MTYNYSKTTRFKFDEAVKGSPNILLDGELVFREMTAMSDLRAYFKKKA
jgi:hypothetical protein